MYEPNLLHTSGDQLVERATTIPTAPTLPAAQQVPQPVVIPNGPSQTYSTARRTTSMTRLLLIRLLRTLGVIGRALWPYRLTLGVSLVFLAIIGVMGAMMIPTTSAQPNFARSASIPPAPSVENFIKGQQSYDGSMMWDSLSEQVKAQMLSRGYTKATWQARADMEKRAGQIYRKYDYIGGVSLQNGGGMYFYLVDVESPQPERNGPTSYVFTVDEDGKILNIE